MLGYVSFFGSVALTGWGGLGYYDRDDGQGFVAVKGGALAGDFASSIDGLPQLSRAVQFQGRPNTPGEKWEVRAEDEATVAVAAGDRFAVVGRNGVLARGRGVV